MGYLSDRQIKARCLVPDGFMPSPDNSGKWLPVISDVTHSRETVENWRRRNYSRFNELKEGQDPVVYGWQQMISPFVPRAVREIDVYVDKDGNAVEPSLWREQGGVKTRPQKIISYGLSSYGYDCRLSGKDLKVFTNINSTLIDPMDVNPDCYVTPEIKFCKKKGLYYFIQPPNSLVLGHTEEYFNIGRDLLVTCLGKSTYARTGGSVIVTPLEPEWEGNLVVEIVNYTNSPSMVYIGCGIAQLLFGKCDEECEVSYKDRGGKYQGQTGTQNSLV